MEIGENLQRDFIKGIEKTIHYKKIRIQFNDKTYAKIFDIARAGEEEPYKNDLINREYIINQALNGNETRQ